MKIRSSEDRRHERTGEDEEHSHLSSVLRLAGVAAGAATAGAATAVTPLRRMAFTRSARTYSASISSAIADLPARIGESGSTLI